MRALLLRLSESKRLAPLMMRNGVSRRVARRFVAGEHLEDALEAAREVNRALQLASLDLLGENVSDEAGARRAADEYIAIFDRIAQEHLDANVSLKLTQLGLDLSEDLCQELLEKIVEHAAGLSNFVRVDMEASIYTQRTVEIVKRVRSEYSNVGTVMQAYLYRAEQDVQDLLAVGCRMRLCKGAYKEPPEVASPNKISSATASSSKCFTAFAPTCSRNWSATVTACACTFRSASIGFPTSCAAWPNAPPM